MALQSADPLANSLYIVFLFGMVLYVLGQKVVRTNIVHLTNKSVFEIRMRLIGRILNSPYHQVEETERERLQTVLNNDTELISQFPHFLIGMITAATTLLFCFMYLGTVNPLGLLLSLLVVTVAVVAFFLAGASANRYLENARSIQEKFFQFINHLTSGLKELNLNQKKKVHFHQDMKESGQSYCDSNTRADMKFINVMVMGELLFTVVVGFVAFMYPVMFKNLSAADVTTFVLVFLYMTGPVNGVLTNIPQLMKIKVAWGRVQDLIRSLDQLSVEDMVHGPKVNADGPVSIVLHDVTYEYCLRIDNDPESTDSLVDTSSKPVGFGVGPVNCDFKSGEITFITGGNGSGKSTLAKLITGLYVPGKGHVSVNGQVVSGPELSQLYSAIFWDYHLFDKFYGIANVAEARATIAAYLERLRLTDIVSIKDGAIDSVRLSTGQKKRMALLVSYLDDRPVYLFDEWAADQDPEYRKVFYREILPELKRQNKCVIVISHDDQYFDVADKVIKMEMGTATVSHQDTSGNLAGAAHNGL
jgi:cyclic peptide transporter